MFAELPASMRPHGGHPGAPLLASLLHAGLIGLGIVVTRQVVSTSTAPNHADLFPLYVSQPQLPHIAPPSAASAATRAPAPMVSVPLSLPTSIRVDVPDVHLSAAASSTGTPVASSSIVLGAQRDVSGSPSPGGAYDARTVDVPVELLRAVPPNYPPALRALGREGVVITRYVVDTLGAVEVNSIQVTDSPDSLFSAAAARALQMMRFKPARVGGRPVRQLVEQHFRFTVGRGE